MRRLRVAGCRAVLLAIGWMVLASAADRLAGRGLLTAPGMPGEGGRALTARAWLALDRGAPSVALARAAVRRRPTDAATLRVAGLTFLAAGDAARADALMRLAGAAGWRDQPTQLYWARAAIADGALDVAAQRLDALMRLNAFEPETFTLLHQLERTPAGRVALSRRAGAPGGGWWSWYLTRMAGLDGTGLQARYATVAATRAHLSRATLDAVAWSFLRADAGDLAERLQRPGDRLAFDPPADPAAPGPFGWTLSAAAGLEASYAGRGSLHVQASGPAVLPFASRLLRRPAGAGVLTVAVAGAHTGMPLLATWGCWPVGDAPAPSLPAPPGVVRFALATPARCATQRLTLLVTGGEAARGADLTLSNARVAAAAP